MDTNTIPADLLAAARKLINSVEFDVNGINGKGGNGGLTSNETIHAAGTLRLIMSRHEAGSVQ
ncbi:hypothetical protein A6R70_14575 [Agrobacterium rubi]|uniref:hypothetical protein n=1 Tax=Agrobacterium rubi TaxID=28099 RepID=UPI00201B6722|nr:hypothetical protein [Agrobacterium rubi]MCL6653514.1 hypothetical protein [Agrobacterium rubi]